MKLYKLTSHEGKTQGDTQWGEGVTHEVAEELRGTRLCSPDVIHAYRDPVLAVMMAEVHVGFADPILWETTDVEECDIVVDDGTKVGLHRLTTARVVEAPTVSVIQHIAFGILAARQRKQAPGFVEWATKWLDGSDRSRDAANTTAYAAADAATYAAYAAADVADAAAQEKFDGVAIAHKAMECV